MRIYNLTETRTRRQGLRSLGTTAEAAMWKLLKGKQINGLRFRRQFGAGPYIIDFFNVEHKLAIEVDGNIHFEAKQVVKDNIRIEYLQSLGISVIRFTNAQVLTNPKGVVEAIKEIVGE